MHYSDCGSKIPALHLFKLEVALFFFMARKKICNQILPVTMLQGDVTC